MVVIHKAMIEEDDVLVILCFILCIYLYIYLSFYIVSCVVMMSDYYCYYNY